MHPVEEGFCDKAEADAEPGLAGGVADIELGIRDGEVRLMAEAGGRPNVDSRIPIACTDDKHLQNRKFRQNLT